MRCNANCAFCTAAAAGASFCSLMVARILWSGCCNGRRGSTGCAAGQQGIEPAGTLKRIEFVTATDMVLADPYLRNGALAAARHDLGTQGIIARHVDLAI